MALQMEEMRYDGQPAAATRRSLPAPPLGPDVDAPGRSSSSSTSGSGQPAGQHDSAGCLRTAPDLCSGLPRGSSTVMKERTIASCLARSTSPARRSGQRGQHDVLRPTDSDDPPLFVLEHHRRRPRIAAPVSSAHRGAGDLDAPASVCSAPTTPLPFRCGRRRAAREPEHLPRRTPGHVVQAVPRAEPVRAQAPGLAGRLVLAAVLGRTPWCRSGAGRPRPPEHQRDQLSRSSPAMSETCTPAHSHDGDPVADPVELVQAVADVTRSIPPSQPVDHAEQRLHLTLLQRRRRLVHHTTGLDLHRPGDGTICCAPSPSERAAATFHLDPVVAQDLLSSRRIRAPSIRRSGGARFQEQVAGHAHHRMRLTSW